MWSAEGVGHADEVAQLQREVQAALGHSPRSRAAVAPSGQSRAQQLAADLLLQLDGSASSSRADASSPRQSPRAAPALGPVPAAPARRAAKGSTRRASNVTKPKARPGPQQVPAAHAAAVASVEAHAAAAAAPLAVTAVSSPREEELFQALHTQQSALIYAQTKLKTKSSSLKTEKAAVKKARAAAADAHMRLESASEALLAERALSHAHHTALDEVNKELSAEMVASGEALLQHLNRERAISASLREELESVASKLVQYQGAVQTLQQRMDAIAAVHATKVAEMEQKLAVLEALGTRSNGSAAANLKTRKLRVKVKSQDDTQAARTAKGPSRPEPEPEPEPEPKPELMLETPRGRDLAAFDLASVLSTWSSPGGFSPSLLSTAGKSPGSLRISASARAAARAVQKATDRAALTEELDRARKKFSEMDVDGSGSLSRDEVAELAQWSLRSFLKSGGDGVEMTAEQVDAETDKVCTRNPQHNLMFRGCI